MQILSRRLWLPILLLMLHLALLLQLQSPGNRHLERGPKPELIVWQLQQPVPPVPPPVASVPSVPVRASRTAPSSTLPTLPRPRGTPRPAPPAPIIAQDQVPASVFAQPAEAPPTTPEPAATPLLDRAALSRAIRNNERNRIKDPLEAVQQREHVDQTVEAAVAKGAKEGARKNCQTDYAGYGLLAVLPLAYGTLTDKGCKWK